MGVGAPIHPVKGPEEPLVPVYLGPDESRHVADLFGPADLVDELLDGLGLAGPDDGEETRNHLPVPLELLVGLVQLLDDAVVAGLLPPVALGVEPARPAAALAIFARLGARAPDLLPLAHDARPGRPRPRPGRLGRLDRRAVIPGGFGQIQIGEVRLGCAQRARVVDDGCRKDRVRVVGIGLTE